MARARSRRDRLTVHVDFEGEVVHWRGPAPFVFIAVPEPECATLRSVAPVASYGWGVIPVAVRVGTTRWTTSLFPKDGGYLVPVKVAVKRAAGIEVGDVVTARVTVEV